MSTSCKNQSKKCSNALFIGLIVGTVYGVCFSEMSGKEMREKIKKSKQPVKDIVQVVLNMDMNFRKWFKGFIEKKLK